MSCDESKFVPDPIRAATEEMIRAAAERDKIQVKRGALLAKEAALITRRDALQAIPSNPVQQAWCADYTEDLAGDVATAEIPGEGIQKLIIRPGYSGRADVTPARDGELNHRAGQVSYQAFLNAALLPGWQKHMPTYRVGTLTAVDSAAHIASVNLDASVSSAQALGINQTSTLTGVPIEYMECNSFVFDVGDRVVIQFINQLWETPKVIGFESNPKPCVPKYVYFPIRAYQSAWVMAGVSSEVYDRLVDEGTGRVDCPDYLQAGSISTVDSGKFTHTLEYRDGAFWTFDGSTDLIYPDGVINTIDQAGFTVWEEIQGVNSGPSFPALPMGTTPFVMDLYYPQYFDVAASSGGIRIEKDYRAPAMDFEAATTQSVSTDDPPCEPGGFVTAHVSGFSTPDYEIAGVVRVQTTIINSTDEAAITAFLASAPLTVSATYDERALTFDSPQAVLNPVLSSRLLLRYELV